MAARRYGADPLSEVFLAAASGRVPGPSDLEDAAAAVVGGRLPAATIRVLAQVSELGRAGERGEARQIARAEWDRLAELDQLTDTPTPTASTDDPAALARAVPFIG